MNTGQIGRASCRGVVNGIGVHGATLLSVFLNCSYRGARHLLFGDPPAELHGAGKLPV